MLTRPQNLASALYNNNIQLYSDADASLALPSGNPLTVRMIAFVHAGAHLVSAFATCLTRVCTTSPYRVTVSHPGLPLAAMYTPLGARTSADNALQPNSGAV
jgi:hypothetical protein